MSDDEFITHLESEHAEAIAHGWAESGKLRRFASRDTYEVYHDCFLHRRPRTSEHMHDQYRWTGWEGKQLKDNKGWTQRTPCVCLHPPQHSPDCTGKLGLTVLDERHGPSIMDNIWAALDQRMDGLKALTFEDMAAARAEAATLAWCLAVMVDPVSPSVETIKAEAVRRWKKRQA